MTDETADLALHRSVGDSILLSTTKWSFGGNTPEHFEVHVRKSIPLYTEGHDLIASLAEFFTPPGSKIIDVGCSTGTLLTLLAERLDGPAAFIGVEIEPDMIRVAREKCKSFSTISILAGDAASMDYSGSNVVILYYTLQFARPEQRREIIKRIFEGLVTGGALFLFEKTLCPDARLQDMVGQLYADYKLNGGFNVQEIYEKNRSLRSVMTPQVSASNHEVLEDVGFESVMTVQKYLCFEGILAIK
ncbi:methyltransferase domain-containing protein [Nocardia aurea]|uniref:methyltransferase domain-containing protein n=1 Tax=Nocardia aurea TaxID=2144174 RepID=UPI00130090CE|nr:methyltransferase domain-containing protein [Nocardia aurea]